MAQQKRPNMQQMLQQVQRVQREMEEAQEALTQRDAAAVRALAQRAHRTAPEMPA